MMWTGFLEVQMRGAGFAARSGAIVLGAILFGAVSFGALPGSAPIAAAQGVPPYLLPSLGGSVPMYLFQRGNTPVVGLPIVNHDNNQHAANENLRIQNLWDGIEIFAALFTNLR